MAITLPSSWPAEARRAVAAQYDAFAREWESRNPGVPLEVTLHTTKDAVGVILHAEGREVGRILADRLLGGS